ncbi:hypothetical protein KEM48_004114 [Puccinia striiformis f. sp. tritici PST-130]|nr:hypothetical protein H4Q26_003562 [Puccinia striiformis f. sp. tritici PST-130]KAI9612383.1 hypothetical protein KEM48_004114 [Puccinia striiformis f. sp. tritici PST-130]
MLAEVDPSLFGNIACRLLTATGRAFEVSGYKLTTGTECQTMRERCQPGIGSEEVEGLKGKSIDGPID